MPRVSKLLETTRVAFRGAARPILRYDKTIRKNADVLIAGVRALL